MFRCSAQPTSSDERELLGDPGSLRLERPFTILYSPTRRSGRTDLDPIGGTPTIGSVGAIGPRRGTPSSRRTPIGQTRTCPDFWEISCTRGESTGAAIVPGSAVDWPGDTCWIGHTLVRVVTHLARADVMVRCDEQLVWLLTRLANRQRMNSPPPLADGCSATSRSAELPRPST